MTSVNNEIETFLLIVMIQLTSEVEVEVESIVLNLNNKQRL